MGDSWYWLAVRKLAEHAQYNNNRYVISATKARWVLGQRLSIPRSLQPVVLGELVVLGLLVHNGKDSFVVTSLAFEQGTGAVIA